MVLLYITSTGEVWVGSDENQDWPTGAAGTLKAKFVIDENPHPQKICTLTGSGNASSSALAAVASSISEDPNMADPFDMSSGGTKFVDIH